MSPIKAINTAGNDHIPEDFTLESLRASSFTDAEMDAMMGGEDPFGIEDNQTPPDDAAAETSSAEVAEPAPQHQPIVVPDTAQAEAIVAKVDADLEALAAKYDDGELTRAEFMAQQKQLVKQQAAAQVEIEKAIAVVQDNFTQRRQTFSKFLETYKAVGNNSLLWSAEHIDGWDSALRAVTGNQAYVHLPLDRQIKLAHDMYAANVKAISGQEIHGSAAETAVPAKTKLGPRTDARPEPVQTLADLNGDTATAMDDGTFASIDRTMMRDPISAEKMLARMSADQQEQYLSRI